jgi:hypothetical protein
MGLGDHDTEHLLNTLRWFDQHRDDAYLATEQLWPPAA